MKNNINENKFHWLYLTGFFIILSLPLWAFPPMFFPPEWGKALVFRIVFSFILFIFIWQIISENNFFGELKAKISAHKKNALLLCAIFLLGLLSTIFSSDVLFSLWSSPHRSGGFVNFAFCILFALILFIIIKAKDWKKLVDFSFIIGIIVTLFAVVQYFDLLPEKVIDFSRPPSTMAIPALLALYLAILSFLALGFALKEKSKIKFFYWISLAIFLFGIFISGSRAAWLSMVVGAFYFFFFYSKRATKIKIITLAATLVMIFGIFIIINSPQTSIFIAKNSKLSFLKDRLSLQAVEKDIGGTRFAAWQTFFDAVKERPVLGWGPENQAIAFDKYYDPSLPYLISTTSDWWDRAHNIFLDLAVQYGAPFLMVYLFFFGYLFWNLQKAKKSNPNELSKIHALQTIFIIYFLNLLFQFDSVSILLLLFFSIGYCLHLTSKNLDTDNEKIQKIQPWLFKKRKLLAAALLTVFIYFLWQGAVKPLYINAEINNAEDLQCNEKIPALQKLLNQKSFLDSFLRLKYADDIKNCEGYIAQDETNYIKKTINELKYNVKIQPNYTRTYIFLAQFNNILIAREENPETKKALLKNSEDWLLKAQKLSPKRQEVLATFSETYFAYNDFEKMKEKSLQCISLGANLNSCYWYLGLSEVALADKKNGEQNIKTAEQKGYLSDSMASRNQLAIVYLKTKDYQKLIPIYQALIKANETNLQYYATLAAIYKESKDYKNARITALKILDFAPEAKDEINAFLKTLPY